MYTCCIKIIPRGDTGGGCEYEVTITSYTLRQKGQRDRKVIKKAASLEAETKTQAQRMVLKHGGVTGESGCGRRPECTG